MTPLRLLFLSAAFAGLGGFLLGWMNGGAGDRGNVSDPAAAEFPPAAHASNAGPAWRRPVIVRGKLDESRLLAELQNGSREELQAILDQIVADKTLPPFLEALYRDEFVERLVKQGVAAELLEPGAYPEKDQAPIAASVIRALAVTDRARAEKLIDGLPPGLSRKSATAALLADLGQRDPRAGLAWLETHSNPGDGSYAFFAAWTKAAPEAAAAAAFAKGRDSRDEQMAVILAWTSDDPDAAWKAIEALPEEKKRGVLEAYLQSLIIKDPARALDAMAKPEFNDSFMGQWIGLIVASDAAGASAAVDRLPPGAGRTAVIRGLATALSGDPEAALAWTNTLLPGERAAAKEELFQSLGRNDPEAALTLAADKLEGPARKKALTSILAGWAQKDYHAAFAAMTAKLDPATLREALPGILRYHRLINEQDYADQTIQIRKLDPATQSEAWRQMGESLAYRSDEMTLAFASRLSLADQQAFAAGMMQRAFEVTPKNLEQITGMLSPDEKARHADDIAKSFAASDPQKAAYFLLTLPEGQTAGAKGSAAQDLVREWAYTEPASAQAFVGALPAGETRDRAAGALAREFRYFDLDRATQVAAQVSGQNARYSVIADLARAWARTDPARGRAIMQTLFHSDEEQKRAAVLLTSP